MWLGVQDWSLGSIQNCSTGSIHSELNKQTLDWGGRYGTYITILQDKFMVLDGVATICSEKNVVTFIVIMLEYWQISHYYIGLYRTYMPQYFASMLKFARSSCV